MRYFKLALKILPIVLVILLIVFLPNLIKIKKLVCVNQYGECDSKTYDKLAGVNELGMKAARKEIDKIFANDYLVKDYSVVFKLPSALSVNILLRKPKYALESVSDQKIVLVDSEGRVLGEADSGGLPKVKVEGNLPPAGQKIKDEYLFSLEIISSIYSLFDIKETTVDGNGLWVSMKDGINVVFPLAGDKKVLVGSLILIDNELKKSIASSKIDLSQNDSVTIDLRFDNPVIRQH